MPSSPSAQQQTSFVSPSLGSYPRDLTNYNGTLYFTAVGNIDDYNQLWKIDPVTGSPILVRSPEAEPLVVQNLTIADGILYFIASSLNGNNLLWKVDPASGNPVEIPVDAGPRTNPSYISNLTSVNNVLYFSASNQIWKIATSTQAPTKVLEGNGDRNSNIVELNGKVYFGTFADLGNNITASYIWAHNPTTGTTTRAGRFLPSSLYYSTSNLTAFNGKLYFSAISGSRKQLWQLNPTTDEITQISNFSNSYDGNLYNYQNEIGGLFVVNGVLYFTADDGPHGLELWKLDNATNSPILVGDINPGSADAAPAGFTVHNGALYFVADDGIHSRELWTLNPATGAPTLVQDIAPGSGSSDPDVLTSLNGTLYFSANDGTHGREPWKLTASTYTPVLIGDLSPSENDSNPNNFTSFGGRVYFTTNNGVWALNPSTGAPTLVKDTQDPNDLTVVNNALYFSSFDNFYGSELSKIDSSTGAVVVIDVNKKANNPPDDLLSFNGTLYFSADDGIHGYELWKLNPATGTAVLVRDIAPGAAASKPYDPGSGGADGRFLSYELTDVGDTLYFAAADGTHGTELWQLNSTSGIPQLVADIAPGSPSSQPFTIDSDGYGSVESYALTNANGTLYFVANDGTHGNELWQVDPAIGTPVLFDLNPGSNNSNPRHLTSVNNTLYFMADNGTQGEELWWINPATGTPANFDLEPGAKGAFGKYGIGFDRVDGTIQFTTVGGDRWQINPTTGQPVRLGEDPLPREESRIYVNNTVYFTQFDPTYGSELWKQDPITGTTTRFDLNPGSGSSDPRNLINVGGTLYFTANDGVHGSELWSIGSFTGNPVLFDINPGSRSSLSPYFSNTFQDINGTLFFVADDGTHGNKLYKIDTTTNSPVRLTDINPGIGSSFDSYFNSLNLTYQNGVLYFNAYDASSGSQVWSLDLGNEAPLNTVPGIQALTKNTPLVFKAANHNAISITDPDAGTNPVRVTLTALNGTLTLGAIANLTFTIGDGTSDSTLAFTGTLPNVNAALNGLTFRPTTGYGGTTSIQITTNDLGNGEAGGAQTDSDLIPVSVSGQVITGTTGNNTLTGTVGRDRFTGGGGKDTFVISTGGSIDSITDFGGVGKGGNPSAVVLANADTLRSSGNGLMAKKMLLTQMGANTEITFVGVNGTKVILQNFTLENLDNHRKSNGAGADVSNILFNGETSAPPTDAFDVWDANLNNTQVFRKNTVTFLNDLSNSVSGFDGSDDVINGQLGNDSLQGKSGKDILRGGVGNDTLLGGADDDVVVGNSGNDLLNGGKGNDVLNGGIGTDAFVFNSNAVFSAADLGVDTIEDFSSMANYYASDRLILDKTTFTQLTFSAELDFGLKAQEFAIVSSDSAAASSSAFITYNSVNGKLFYNQNGSSSGFGSGAQFATLSGSPVLSVQSFALQA